MKEENNLEEVIEATIEAEALSQGERIEFERKLKQKDKEIEGLNIGWHTDNMNNIEAKRNLRSKIEQLKKELKGCKECELNFNTQAISDTKKEKDLEWRKKIEGEQNRTCSNR